MSKAHAGLSRKSPTPSPPYPPLEWEGRDRGFLPLKGSGLFTHTKNGRASNRNSQIVIRKNFAQMQDLSQRQGKVGWTKPTHTP